ncbi:hypothetical protein DFJ73DRAFT_206594 [Zopfochytrium polystomum]|nr:hypothetical protein DFJ73DRAFT_206594 [Zopfochytrium polystomum]
MSSPPPSKASQPPPPPPPPPPGRGGGVGGADSAAALELKALVAEVLSRNGVLGKIKAELRAAVYSALQEVEGQTPRAAAGVGSPSVRALLSSDEGSLALALVHDFLECCNLDHTLTVLMPEAAVQTTSMPSKTDMQKRLTLGAATSPEPRKPLLLRLIEERAACTTPTAAVPHSQSDGGIPAAGQPPNQAPALTKIFPDRPVNGAADLSHQVRPLFAFLFIIGENALIAEAF